MTEAQFTSFVKGHLRRASRWWKPISEVLKKARVSKGHYLCNGCKQTVTKSILIDSKRINNIHIDHEPPVVDPITGFNGWDSFINRLFTEEDGLQLLCKSCHEDVKSKQEDELRRSQKALREKFPREYQSWSNMNDRCTNPNSTGWEYYGEKGIKVCERWARLPDNPEALSNFISDLGPRPEHTSLERLDTLKNYDPENCVWADRFAQANNKTDNHYIAFNGTVLTLQQWSIQLGIKANTLLYRLRRGWTPEEAFNLTRRERPHTSKLTKDQWLEIQALRNDGCSTVELGKMFDIDPSQISRYTINPKTQEERRLSASTKKEEE